MNREAECLFLIHHHCHRHHHHCCHCRRLFQSVEVLKQMNLTTSLIREEHEPAGDTV